MDNIDYSLRIYEIKKILGNLDIINGLNLIPIKEGHGNLINSLMKENQFLLTILKGTLEKELETINELLKG